jgi:NAD(P)-dependent dehydrogenase (short-subunit alcohol dehydrogenase family)
VEAVLPGMTERKTGSIVLIATTSAGEAMGGPQAYNAMKASLITYGKQLASNRSNIQWGHPRGQSGIVCAHHLIHLFVGHTAHEQTSQA